MRNKLRKVFLILIFLPSCSAGSIYSELFESLKVLISEPQDISLDQVNNVQFSSMQARIGNAPNSLVVLEEVNGDTLKWTSSNFIKIYTLNGYVIRLKGFENELDNIDLDINHPAKTLNFDQKDKVFTSFYTFRNPKLFRLPIKSTFSFLNEEIITVLGKDYKTKKYIEKVEDNLISWNFENHFWINEDKQIIKSEQYFTPKNPKIYLMVTKKYNELIN